jgi:Rod binding domain-containing protein
LHAASSSPERSAKIKQAAHDFESVLVRQLLKASKIGGESKGGYGDMAVDALADGIERGGGLGLASCIEHALARTSR